ncbi:uncharacterized protein BO66DRAFT_224444 [Aspergillus aculeatinus CBS 121060]|uniref:Uncharacterized protein n=1 Tax=Aspergillus aculeatinus CBS 121060 TaxID=1448322 RepID=A0ACD1HJ15_9EURO|nr:hypothetical protein BO66DRAFT_224444 [Aspergillus aculeatinus CBS 121060]RAH73506.1 hypothetical protein BO66DRAFT_224444 [Aspergillus aculeatinus CBS 121060]
MSDLYCPLPPRGQDIFRFRRPYGVNLGSTFTQGPSLHQTTAPTELEALTSSIETNGLESTASTWQSHWLSALPNDELLWLRDTCHCNTIQLPLGFLTLGPLFSQGTPFEGAPSQVYTRCWSAIKHLIERCHAHGIGILLNFDLTTNGVNLRSSSERLALARDCIAFVAQEVTFHALHGVVGLRISTSKETPRPGSPTLRDWYKEIRMIVGAIDEFLPLYIGDNSPAGTELFRDCETPLHHQLLQADSKQPAPAGRATLPLPPAAPGHLLLSRDEVQTKAQQARIERPQLLREALARLEGEEEEVKGEKGERAKEKYCHRAVGRQSFVHGWDLGYSDALRFFDAAVEGLVPQREGADRIGEVELWARRRASDVARLEENHQAWELGLRRGIADFNQFVGI